MPVSQSGACWFAREDEQPEKGCCQLLAVVPVLGDNLFVWPNNSVKVDDGFHRVLGDGGGSAVLGGDRDLGAWRGLSFRWRWFMAERSGASPGGRGGSGWGIDGHIFGREF